MNPMIGAVAGVALAVLLLVPLSLKWQLPQRTVWTWAVLLGASTGALWAALLGEVTQGWTWALAQTASVLVISGLAAAVMFFRDPDRDPPLTPDVIVSPADGQVVYVRSFSRGCAPPIEKQGRALEVGELARVDVGDEGHLIGIGMHLLNVHVNRAPVAGRVATLLHVPGRFESLRREGATAVNERFTTTIDGERGPVFVVQIASRLVRRIVSYLDEGQDIARGQRIGMIKFGSQVDVVIPANEGIEILAKPGDVVQAGVSVIARYTHRNTAKE
jgi:phosphatidylserine decarboxylase